MSLVLEEADVKRMLVDLGMPEERLTSTTLITKRVNRLLTIENDLLAPESRESALLRDRVLLALKAGEDIVMSGSESGNGAATAVAEAPVKKEKKAKVAKESKPAVERDKYGMNKEKPPGLINACISKKHKSPETIAEESSQPLGRVKNHLNYWQKKPESKLGALLEKDEDGRWFLKA